MKNYIIIAFTLLAVISCKKEDYRDKFEGTYSGIFYNYQTTTNTNIDVVKFNNNEISVYRNSTHLFNAEIIIDGTFDNGYNGGIGAPNKYYGYFKLDSLYFQTSTGGAIPIYSYFKGKKQTL